MARCSALVLNRLRVATSFAAGGERWKRITAAFDWHGVVLPANFRVDAWVIPPAYTGKPPLILPGIHPGETAALPTNGIVAVPVNSTLVVRSTGKVSLHVSGIGGVTPAKDAVHAPAGTDEHRFAITATGSATLRGAGDDLTWAFNVIPDKPPTIELTKDPELQRRGSLLLSYRLEDDYGVTEAQATFARKNDADADGEDPHPLFGPPDFALILPQARTRAGVAQTIKDLTDHPWAGAEVDMTLVARDEGGNVGKSEPFAFRLPERAFTKPLARALVEQRRNLALDANARPLVLTALDALALAPEKFTPEAGTFLGLRGIFWSLVRAKTDDDLRDVAARLWSMAVQLEDGDISDAQANLRNAEEALRQALERGASDEELKALMDQLRAAMDRFMQAMAEQLKNSQQLARPLGPNQRMLSQRDLQSMLDRLENLAKNGARDAAKQLLQQLQQMMENLQMASPDGNGDDGDDMMSALDELGDMIRQQQDLRDRTFRQGQDQRHKTSAGKTSASKASSAASNRGPASRDSKANSRATAWASCGRASRRCAIASTNCSKSSRTAALARTSRASKARVSRARMTWTSSAAPARRWDRPKAVSARAIPTARWIPKAARSKPCARARSRWRNPCSSRWGRAPGRPAAPAGLANRAPTAIPIRSAGRCAAATTATTPPCGCRARSTCSAPAASSRNCASASATWAARRKSSITSSGC